MDLKQKNIHNIVILVPSFHNSIFQNKEGSKHINFVIWHNNSSFKKKNNRMVHTLDKYKIIFF